MNFTKALTQSTAIILAAGRGSRMNAKNKNKVAFKLSGQPMISHTVNHLNEAGISNIIAVVGYRSESVKQALGNKATYVTQSEQLGTGDAIKTAIPNIPLECDVVLTVSGDDSAFYPPDLYLNMVKRVRESNCDLLFLTIHKDNPTGLGRIVRDQDGKVIKIVEEKNASDEERLIKEINTGFYCFDREFLVNYIDQIKKNPLTGEYYLTDMIEIAIKHGKKVEAYFVKDDSIWHGVNNRSDFAKAQAKLRTE